MTKSEEYQEQQHQLETRKAQGTIFQPSRGSESLSAADVTLLRLGKEKQELRQKERERINERNDFFAEAEKLDEEARQRRLKLEEVKRKKLNELKYVDNVCYLIIMFIFT